MKKLFLSMMLMALPLLVSAYDIQVTNADGNIIYYNYINNSTELEVTFKSTSDNIYHGTVNIPEEVTYMSRTRKVTSIGPFAFSGSRDLISVTIPKSITSIQVAAFKYCPDLASVNIPNSVISIGSEAFYGCNNLTSVTIPNSVTSIENSTFFGCRSLTSVAIPHSVTNIGNSAFYGCGGLTSVTIPNSVTSIGGGAFYGCYNLTSATIPNSVTSIENSAFEGCSRLNSLTIPNSVTSIGDDAFKKCTGLASVISKMENPCSINSDCFHYDIFFNVTLYVPEGTIDKYRSTDFWSKFVYIEEGEPESTQPDEKKCATPNISYADKKLTFSCATEGAQCLYTITDSDIKTDLANEVSLTATYNVSVYATKSGYTNSDVATATLVWTDAIFTETTPETPTSAKAVQESIPVLISAKGGNISVKCEADGQEVNVYTIDGLSLGTATVKNGEALISTSIPSGDIAVVKVGGRSVKVLMR